MPAQPQPQEQAAATRAPRVRGDWEFLWRFIAVALLFALGWVAWIALQIHLPPVAMPAAYEAAKAAAARSATREPLVNVEKLKFSDSIETAIPQHPEKRARPRTQ